jgi:hypothetical protein
MNEATLTYRGWWDIYEFPPEGWVIDENTGSPLCGHDFYTNGKSPLNGQKRALVMSKKLTHEQREHIKALLQEKLSHGKLLAIK